MDALSNWAYRDLCYMFADRELVMNLLETDEKDLAKHCNVNKDGSVTIGKTPYKWINLLFGAEKTISCETICFRLIKTITGFGGSRNNEAYKDLCERFSNYYKDGNFSLAISAIFVAYRFVLAPDIKAMTEDNPIVERKGKSNKNILINGILLKDSSGGLVALDMSDPNQYIFRRP